MVPGTGDAETRRVGVFGGTFDPPHVAHVVVAAAAVHQLGLDRLMITVAGEPWQKVGTRKISDARLRLEMSRLAFAPVDKVIVSDMEIRRSGNSYTIDTLQELADDRTDLFLLLGSDTATGLDTWERPHEMAELATIVVFPRRGYETATVPDGFQIRWLEMPGLEVSSSDIRRRVPAGEPIAGLVPSSVQRLIAAEGLYEA